jgi:hypothetical protein
MSDVTATKAKKEKVAKVAKAPKPDKYNGFKVPSKGNRHKATPWARFIYDMIQEAKPDLLAREDVKVAYNNLVECLSKYETDDTQGEGDYGLRSWIPSKHSKYRMGIKPEEYGSSRGLPFSYNNNYYKDVLNVAIRERTTNIYTDIHNTYKVLYDLIKRDVVPYMEIKEWENTSKKTVQNYHSYMERLENEIKHYEKCIQNHHKLIGEYAKKCVDLQTPPKTTKFD